MFEHVLVPLDGSQRAERALPTAARIAHATNGTVVLLRVVGLPVEYLGSLAPAPLISNELIEQEQAEAASYLAALAQSESLKEKRRERIFMKRRESCATPLSIRREAVNPHP